MAFTSVRKDRVETSEIVPNKSFDQQLHRPQESDGDESKMTNEKNHIKRPTTRLSLIGRCSLQIGSSERETHRYHEPPTYPYPVLR